MADNNIPGATMAVRHGTSLARSPNLPYEIQHMIFKLANTPQTFFLSSRPDGDFTVIPPPEKAISLSCHLARSIYIKNKILVTIAGKDYWVNTQDDIFYYRAGGQHPAPVFLPAAPRINLLGPGNLPPFRPGNFLPPSRANIPSFTPLPSRPDRSFMQRIAVDDLNFASTLHRIFPDARSLDIWVPKGAVGAQLHPWAAQTVVLEELPITAVVGSPTHLAWSLRNYIERSMAYRWNVDRPWEPVKLVVSVSVHWASVRK